MGSRYPPQSSNVRLRGRNCAARPTRSERVCGASTLLAHQSIRVHCSHVLTQPSTLTVLSNGHRISARCRPRLGGRAGLSHLTPVGFASTAKKDRPVSSSHARLSCDKVSHRLRESILLPGAIIRSLWTPQTSTGLSSASPSSGRRRTARATSSHVPCCFRRPATGLSKASQSPARQRRLHAWKLSSWPRRPMRTSNVRWGVTSCWRSNRAHQQGALPWTVLPRHQAFDSRRI